MRSAFAVMRALLLTSVCLLCVYIAFIALLIVPALQDHVIYMHRATLTWFQDVNFPEQWGFLRNQVTPFYLETADGEHLHAWHILPLDVYLENERELHKESPGLCENVEDRLSFRLLQHDPNVRLVVYLHGAGGTLGSGWRPQSYRALSAACDNVHVLAIDYRGFGSSTGWPSEMGLLTDALTLVEFAIRTAGISPNRIVLFAQSMGTAVALSLTHHLAVQSPPILFAGTVLVAPFADVASLSRTYKIGGVVPLLSPLSWFPFPKLLAVFNGLIISKWPSQEKLADTVRHLDSIHASGRKHGYDITLIHAQDDHDVPSVHSDILFWHSVDAALQSDLTVASITSGEKSVIKSWTSLEADGEAVIWHGKGGTIRKHIVMYGSHDRIMSHPVVSLAVARAFETRDVPH
ncbi:hypothetical protein E8E12_000699 [Didymella heteroderae]|uniref:AB hydrolase-1 domain-containing protein n=1 Tax=Didymella heteroderae TaxID=1769908 RepID=A0A9P4WFL6_9PLEO|nr:hypothetical protein E8E12_000699 [Didymella heteroderae]